MAYNKFIRVLLKACGEHFIVLEKEAPDIWRNSIKKSSSDAAIIVLEFSIIV